jgi:hypothetical protein
MMTESERVDDDLLMQLADGEMVYLAERRAAEREHPIFEEIRAMIVDIATRYADPASVSEALPRLTDLLKRLQAERAISDRDLDKVYAQQAAIREELRSRLAKGELAKHVVDQLFNRCLRTTITNREHISCGDGSTI